MKRAGMVALMELFSDGELRVLTPEQAGYGEALRQPAEERFGEFYRRMAGLRTRLVAAEGPLVDEMNKLARFSGRLLARFERDGIVQLPEGRLIQPGLDAAEGTVTLAAAGHTWKAPRQGIVVVEYGPGLVGRKMLETQVEALQQGRVPFQYIAVSDGPFVNEYLTQWYGTEVERRIGAGAAQLLAGKLFIGREDGMLQATESLAESSQRPDGGMGDVLLFSGVHEANPLELKYALQASPRLLAPEGRVLLGAPLAKVSAATTAYGEQLAWVTEVGLVPEWEGSMTTGNAALDRQTVSGVAVLRKAAVPPA